MIAADGALQSLAWRESRAMGKLAAARLGPIARQWQFEAGRVDGAAAETQTTLTVEPIASAEPDGSVRLRVEDAYTGASSLSGMAPPAYPGEALREGGSARVVAHVRVAADGPAEISELQFSGGARNSYEKKFVEAARVAIASWQFKAERVGGRPVPTEMRVPITFCADAFSRWCRELEVAEEARPRSGPPGMPVPTDSIARLLTDVRNVSI